MTTAAHVANLLCGGGYSLPGSAEVHLQTAAIARLREAGLQVQAEMISGKNRFDIRVAPGVVVEVKVDGATDSVKRQLERYAADAAVTGVVLLTTKSKHRCLGGVMQGKQVIVAYAIRF